MVDAPKVYDVRHVKCVIRYHANVGTDVGPIELTGLAPDGFGITPAAEATAIKGLAGEVGFNIDPSTAAEATITLKSTSPNVPDLFNIIDRQNTDDPPGYVSLDIIVDPGHEGAFGFSRLILEYAMFTKYPEFATDEKEAPDIEFTLIGYNFRVVR